MATSARTAARSRSTGSRRAAASPSPPPPIPSQAASPFRWSKRTADPSAASRAPSAPWSARCSDTRMADLDLAKTQVVQELLAQPAAARDGAWLQRFYENVVE